MVEVTTIASLIPAIVNATTKVSRTCSSHTTYELKWEANVDNTLKEVSNSVKDTYLAS